MSDLIINAPTPTAQETAIKSSVFWPDVDPAKIREDQRIDTTITPGRLRSALIEAIATTNNALLSWRSTQESAGFANIAAVPAETIDQVSIHLHRYQRAVGCLAKALLLERYPDYDATAKGERKAEAITSPIDDCRRDHLNAIADITGRPRATVELI